MFAKNNRISGRQAMRLMTFDLLGYSALMIPARLAATAGRDGIWGIVLGMLGGLIYLSLLRVVLRKMKDSFGEYLEDLTGALAGRIIKLVYAVLFLLLAGRVAAVFAKLVVAELLEKQFRQILVIILLLVFYGVTGSIEGRARVYEILFWILLLPLFVMMACAVPSADPDYWMPVFTEPLKAVWESGCQVFLCFSILCLIPFLAEFVQEKEQLYQSGRNALLLVGGILLVLYLLLLGMFGEKALATIDYPVVTMMSRVQMTGGFLKRIDAIMFGIWFFTLFALLCSLVFFGGRLWREVLKTEHAGRCMALEAVVVFVVADCFYLHEGFARFCENFFRYVGTPFVVLVPVLLIGMEKGRKSAS